MLQHKKRTIGKKKMFESTEFIRFGILPETEFSQIFYEYDKEMTSRFDIETTNQRRKRIAEALHIKKAIENSKDKQLI